jgi:hypothetical protein
MVALTIAGLIALAARAAVVGGLDTQERLTRHTTASENELRFRGLLVQALRHITDAPVPEQPPFVVRDTVHNNVPSQVAEFYSRGFGHPAGTGPIVHVRIAPASEGLTLTATLHGSTLFSGQLPDAVAMHLRARMPSGEWVVPWPRTLQVPTALEVNFTPATGAAATLPLFVSTRLEEVQ